MCLISSPAAYSLCSLNSTDCPCEGLLCSPVSTPSITLRARICSGPSRARSAGSRLTAGLRASGSGLRQGKGWRSIACIARRAPVAGGEWERSAGARSLEPGASCFGLAQELRDHLARIDALGFGVEVGEHAVAEDGLGESAHVLHGGRRAPLQGRAGLRRQDERLGSARTRAPAHVILHVL